jgi:hypothetical protein
MGMFGSDADLERAVMEDVTRSMGERILLAAKIAATLHLLEDVKEQRVRRMVEVGGADADRFTDGAPSYVGRSHPGSNPGAIDLFK